MLLCLQRYNHDLIFTPESQVILADTLSRAYPSSPSDVVGTEFPAELASLMDEQQMADLNLVASDKTIRFLIAAAAASDDDYQQLVQQIRAGWPTSAVELHPEAKPYASFADELAISGGLVFKRASGDSSPSGQRRHPEQPLL